MEHRSSPYILQPTSSGFNVLSGERKSMLGLQLQVAGPAL